MTQSYKIYVFLIGFFISILLAGCRYSDKPTAITIQWQENKASGLIIPLSLIDEQENASQRLKVIIAKSDSSSAILGDFKTERDEVIFNSFVPLTRGLHYEILLDDEVIGEIEIPVSESQAPELLSVYPTQDTVPENLLKMYLHFSQSMTEGKSLSHVALIGGKGDTLKGTFLDLQPELWNNDGTILTLWLDPGRIKRDLIPNKELGIPLKKGEHYTITVAPGWKSKDGKSLSNAFSKTFITSSRDEKSPDISTWTIKSPAAGSKDALQIDLHESLDYSLLMDVVSIVDEHGIPFDAIIELDSEESVIRFIPSQPWKAGEYAVRAEGILEDLAGNNLNRVFDRDLKSEEAKKKSQDVFEKKLVIH